MIETFQGAITSSQVSGTRLTTVESTMQRIKPGLLPDPNASVELKQLPGRAVKSFPIMPLIVVFVASTIIILVGILGSSIDVGKLTKLHNNQPTQLRY